MMALMGDFNVPPSHAPGIFKFVAAELGVTLPGRERKCVAKKKGVEEKVKEVRWMPWVCSVTTCKFLRSMMGSLSDLQVSATTNSSCSHPHPPGPTIRYQRR